MVKSFYLPGALTSCLLAFFALPIRCNETSKTILTSDAIKDDYWKENLKNVFKEDDGSSTVSNLNYNY